MIELMDEIVEEIKIVIAMIFCIIFALIGEILHGTLYILLLFTSPAWIIPYLLIKNIIKKHKKEELEHENINDIDHDNNKHDVHND